MCSRLTGLLIRHGAVPAPQCSHWAEVVWNHIILSRWPLTTKNLHKQIKNSSSLPRPCIRCPLKCFKVMDRSKRGRVFGFSFSRARKETKLPLITVCPEDSAHLLWYKHKFKERSLYCQMVGTCHLNSCGKTQSMFGSTRWKSCFYLLINEYINCILCREW